MTDVIIDPADAGNKAPDDANKELNKEAKKVYDEEYVNTVKAESIARGKKLKEVEEKLKKLEDEKLSETEKDKKRITDLEAEKNQILTAQKEKDIDNLILKKSTGKSIVDIDALMIFAKKELADVENVDDKAVEGVIEKILKEKAYLVSTSNVIPGDGNFGKKDNEQSQDVDALFGKMIRNTKGN